MGRMWSRGIIAAIVAGCAGLPPGNSPLDSRVAAALERRGLGTDALRVVDFERRTPSEGRGEHLDELRTRPDFAVQMNKALIGFVEVKAPGKGADPRKFEDKHDKEQWDKLKALPNLIYTDGNALSLWQNGSLVGDIVKFDGDIETSGAKLGAPASLLLLIQDFLSWQPIAPKGPKELAAVAARLCRYLRDEVIEQLGVRNARLSGLKEDWKALAWVAEHRFPKDFGLKLQLLLQDEREKDVRERLKQIRDALQTRQTAANDLKKVEDRLEAEHAGSTGLAAARDKLKAAQAELNTKSRPVLDQLTGWNEPPAAGSTVREIFEREGEARFRELEAAARPVPRDIWLVLAPRSQRERLPLQPVCRGRLGTLFARHRTGRSRLAGPTRARQHLARPHQHRLRQPRELGHVDAVGAVGRARRHLVQEHDLALPLLDPHRMADQAGKPCRQRGQLVVPRGRCQE